MRPPPRTAHRAPPEHVDRATRLGADQYVLACNARRDADDFTFEHLERLERENHQLRAEVQWKLAHASTRTSRWVWTRVIVATCLLAGLAGIGGWLLTPNGHELRRGVTEGYQQSRAQGAP